MGRWVERILKFSTDSVSLAALLIAVSGFVSRLLGFVRDRLLAHTFGAGEVLDAYYAAFRVPDMLFELLVAGALSAAFVPVFTQLWTRGDTAAAWRMAQGVAMMLFAVLVVVSGAAAWMAPWLVPLLVPGFDEDTMALTIQLTRMLLLSPVLLGMSALCSSVLVARRRFAAYALAPLLYNGGILFGIIVLVPTMGVSGVAGGVIIGALLHLVVTSGAAMLTGLATAEWRWAAPWNDTHVRRVIRMMVPRMASAATWQLHLLAVAFFASLSTAGALAAFTFAYNISMIPVGLIGVPFAVAAFSTLSAHAARSDMDAFVRMIIRTVRRALFLVTPLLVVLVVLRAQIVRVVLGSGVFDWADTIMTFQMVGVLAISLFAAVMTPLLSRAFYALNDTVTPLISGLVSVAVTVVGISVLREVFGVYAIALGVSLGLIVHFLLLFVFLERRVRHAALTEMHNAVLGALGAALLGSGVTVLVAHFEGISLLPQTVIGVMGLAAVWVGVFVVIAVAVRVPAFFVQLVSMAAISVAVMQSLKVVVGTVTDLSTMPEVLAQLVISGGAGVAVYLFLGQMFGMKEVAALRTRVWRLVMPRAVAGGRWGNS